MIEIDRAGCRSSAMRCRCSSLCSTLRLPSMSASIDSSACASSRSRCRRKSRTIGVVDSRFVFFILYAESLTFVRSFVSLDAHTDRVQCGVRDVAAAARDDAHLVVVRSGRCFAIVCLCCRADMLAHRRFLCVVLCETQHIVVALTFARNV
jgi:hypothetical protein